MTPAEQLCLACGLCCDGTLFDNVRLGAGDDAQGLGALGLPVTRLKSDPTVALFRQPCAALCQDRTCQLYTDRPRQCRDFECGVFKDLHAGRIEFAAALRLVKRTRQNADGIRRLLRALGDADENRPLGERFRRTKRRMESGAADAVLAGQFAELSLAMHAFNLRAHEKFYTRPGNP